MSVIQSIADDEVRQPPRPVLHPGDLVARRRSHARPQARRDVRGLRSLRRRAAGRARRAGHLPRRHPVPLAAGAAGGRPPPAAAVSSTVKKENDLLAVDLANPDLKDAGGSARAAARRRCTSSAARFSGSGVCYERLRVSNFGRDAVRRRAGGSTSTPTSPTSSRCAAPSGSGAGESCTSRSSATTSVVLGYEGLDGRDAADPGRPSIRRPTELSGRQARYHLSLGPRQTVTLLICHRLRAGSGGASPGDARARPAPRCTARARRTRPSRAAASSAHQRRSRRVAAPVDRPICR